MAKSSSEKFDRHSTRYDYDDDDDDLDFEESAVVPVKLEFPPTNDAILVEDSIKKVCDYVEEDSLKMSEQLQGTESKDERVPIANNGREKFEEIILDDSSSCDLFEEKTQSKPDTFKPVSETGFSTLVDPVIFDFPVPSSVSTQKIATSHDTVQLGDLPFNVSDQERNYDEEVEQDGFSDPSKIVVFEMIDFSLFDKAAEQSSCPASSTDVATELPSQTRSEGWNFKRTQTNPQHNDLMSLDGELLTFPSQVRTAFWVLQIHPFSGLMFMY